LLGSLLAPATAKRGDEKNVLSAASMFILLVLEKGREKLGRGIGQNKFKIYCWISQRMANIANDLRQLRQPSNNVQSEPNQKKIPHPFVRQANLDIILCAAYI
jgi:hypothetical protein